VQRYRAWCLLDNVRQRAPSVIVYTPGGFVGVHFPTLGRSPFAGKTPITGDELVVTIPSTNPQSTFATTVRLQRLSGVDDMLPSAR